MIKHLQHIPIFNRAVFFVGNCSAKKASDVIYKLKRKGTKVEFTLSSNGGVREANGDVFIWVKDLNYASIVAHELAHAAVSIMECANIPLCSETEELMCYLIEWLKINVQDKVYNKLNKD